MREAYIGSLGYRLYKHYVRFVHNKIFYRKIYYINKENVPTVGQPCLIVSNHQNCANDPLVLLLGFDNETHPYVIARANVFYWSVALRKFFFWIGMLPAFRLDYDGAESLEKNDETIRISGQKMLDGNRLIMYPEGTHQDKHWLGTFSYGYTRLAFQTAEKDNFEHDILILPTANHYKSYFEVKSDAMITFGTPISLKPYYELYKEKPRTAQREVNKLVRKQISEMMLNIEDLEHYEAIDWLRESQFGEDWCRAKQLNPDYLPDKLQSDKSLVAALADAKPDESLYNEILDIKKAEEKLGISDVKLRKIKSWGIVLLSCLAQILLLPLWLVSLYPNIIHYNCHRPFMRSDKMFTNSWRLIIPIIVGYPLFFIGTVLLCGLIWGWWWQSIIAMLLSFYPLSVFALYEWKWMKDTYYNIKALCCKKKLKELNEKRNRLFNKIIDILK